MEKKLYTTLIYPVVYIGNEICLSYADEDRLTFLKKKLRWIYMPRKLMITVYTVLFTQGATLVKVLKKNAN